MKLFIVSVFTLLIPSIWTYIYEFAFVGLFLLILVHLVKMPDIDLIARVVNSIILLEIGGANKV
jgi:hypothetical protein